MSFLKKFFSSEGPLVAAGRALEQKRWADALAIGEEAKPDALDEPGRRELEKIVAAAGDALAELNLQEGDAFLRAGDPAKAREHFTLAASLARGEEMIMAARSRLASPPEAGSDHLEISAATAAAHGCGVSCGSAPPAIPSEIPEELDQRTRLELILTSYPADLAKRCERLTEPLLNAFLLSHDNLLDEALAQFDLVPVSERDDIFHFERGALLARAERVEEAVADLEQAVACQPGHILALETLVSLELLQEREAKAEQRLRQMLADGLAPAFAHRQLAVILARRSSDEEALEHALAAGDDPESLLLASALLERQGRLAEAESLLHRLPAGGGCSPGQTSNLSLAEFWLRQRKNLDQALDAFSKAVRQEPGNTRWLMRLAEVHLVLGRQREGRQLLEQILTMPGTDPELRRSVEALRTGLLNGSA